MHNLGTKYKIILVAAVIVGLISLAAWHFQGSSVVNLNHPPRGAEEPPLYLGEIKLAKGSLPIWVYFSNNRLYISYYDKEEVEEYSPVGEKIKEFVPRLTDNKAAPQGMASIEDKMLVADYDNGSVGLVDNVGKVLEGFSETPNQQPFKPIGVFARHLVYYVTDELVNGWMAIGNDGYLINMVKGEGDSYLEFPYGIAVTVDGRVVVTDPAGGKIKAYTCSGMYIYDFPTAKNGIKNPQGISIDGHDRIHVVDNGNNNIAVYSNEGRYMFTYGEKLNNPSTITVDPERRNIYIANTENSSVSVWGY